MVDLKYYSGTLTESFATYSPTCLRKVFRNKKVSHILPYPKPQTNDEMEELFMQKQKTNFYFGRTRKTEFAIEKNQLRVS